MSNPSPVARRPPPARRLLTVALLVIAMLAATWIGGWLGVALVAAAWGWRGRALDSAIAAFVAWVALLAFAGGTGLLPFARRLGGIFSLPGWAMLVITPLFAGSLAWGVAALLGSRRPSPGARGPASNP